MEPFLIIIVYFTLLGWIYVLCYNKITKKYNKYRLRRKIIPS